jgi:SAM-dependent methyltransferase
LTELEAYAKRYAAQYGERSFETLLVAVRRRHVLHWLAHYQARRILEVGCGLEPLFSHYGDFDAWRIVEPVADFARQARKVAAGDARINVSEGYLEEQAGILADEDFDFIVVSSLLHEVGVPLRLLEAVHSLCEDTTIVHVNVPNMLSFHRLLALEMGLIADVFETSEMDRAFGHHGRFDHERLIELLTRANFRIAESGTYFVKPFTHDQMDTILRTGVFPPPLLDGLDRMIKYMPDHGCELYANVRKA